MSYKVIIKRQAKRKLSRLSAPTRVLITEAIITLGADPDKNALDIKQLKGSRLWRVRVGGWRIIYDRQDIVKIIQVEKIKPRGDAYK